MVKKKSGFARFGTENDQNSVTKGCQQMTAEVKQNSK